MKTPKRPLLVAIVLTIVVFALSSCAAHADMPWQDTKPQNNVFKLPHNDRRHVTNPSTLKVKANSTDYRNRW